jgi:transcription antitermination factor NusG
VGNKIKMNKIKELVMERNFYDWYVVYTRQGMELKVAKELSRRKIESYCPVNKAEAKWWTLKKNGGQPLFTSCVFVKISEAQVPELRKINGVVNVLYWLGKPAVVKDQDISQIRNFLCNHSNVSVERTQVRTMTYVQSTTAQSTEESKAGYRLDLPALGFRVIAGKPASVKVVPMPAAKPVATPATEFKQQYSNAG